MAEVRHCFGRGAYVFAQKLFNRHLLESVDKYSTIVEKSVSWSPGLLVGCFKNGGLYRAEEASDKVTAGAPQVSFSGSGTPELGTCFHVWRKEKGAEYYHRRGIKHFSFHNKTWGGRVGEKHAWRMNKTKLKRTSATPSPYGQWVFIREFSGNGSRSEPLYKTKTGYYEILDVLPDATHAQVKTAYYKQSFIYHPDRNAGSEEATTRFADINEAYTVLGNKTLRKRYDRGLLSASDLISSTRPSARDGTGGSAKQTDGRRSVMGTGVRGSVYDFDDFIKSHYSGQLQNQRDIRARREKRLQQQQESMAEKNMDMAMELSIGLATFALVVGLLLSLKR